MNSNWQLREQARRVKATPYFQTARIPLAPRLQPGGSILRATVTTAIPTGTIGTPSTTGQVTLYHWDPDAATSAISTDPSEVNMRCCNDHTLSASVPGGTTVKVAWIDGDLWLVASDCY
jgi:hypothetical protein